ncbi:MAG TPA: VOC family protein [Candidatus Cryosericum sp.]|nr:VOC family protein [Candidatus Cryosericum sp.]
MSRSTGRSRVAPEGWTTVVPRIVAQDARSLVEFVTRVFDATGAYREDRPSDLRIGDSVLMISDAGIRQPTAAFLYVYVRDADATYRRALEAGARSLEDPMDTPYGDRRCMLEDRWGNTWQIATYRAPKARRRPKRRARRSRA